MVKCGLEGRRSRCSLRMCSWTLGVRDSVWIDLYTPHSGVEPAEHHKHHIWHSPLSKGVAKSSVSSNCTQVELLYLERVLSGYMRTVPRPERGLSEGGSESKGASREHGGRVRGGGGKERDRR